MNGAIPIWPTRSEVGRDLAQINIGLTIQEP